MLFDPKFDVGFKYGWSDDRHKTKQDAIKYIQKLNPEDHFNKGMISALKQRFEISQEELSNRLKEETNNTTNQDNIDLFFDTRETDFEDSDLKQPIATEDSVKFHGKKDSENAMNKILDLFNNGKITEEKAKAMISEFANNSKNTFKTGSSTFLGSLGV